MGFDRCVDMLTYAYERGIRFFDSADQYGSHPEVAETLRRVGRENVVVTTKTTARNRDEALKAIPRFLKELKTDHLDIVLLHCMTNAEWPRTMRPVMDVLSDFKRQGILRAVGVSCHDFGAFKAASDEPWVEVVLARLNYSGVLMDEHPDHVTRVVRKMHKSGKGIYAMKVVGQKQLASEWRHAVRFVHDLDCVDAMVLGMESKEEVDRNVDYIEELERLVPPTTTRPAESASTRV
jgi:predicted aldo/keto reductase-like oxidoreductase